MNTEMYEYFHNLKKQKTFSKTLKNGYKVKIKIDHINKRTSELLFQIEYINPKRTRKVTLYKCSSGKIEREFERIKNF